MSKYLRPFILSLLILTTSAAQSQPVLKQSNQLLRVTAANWNALEATLQRYQRVSSQHPWVAIGNPLTVVIGKNGMAWGVGFDPFNIGEPLKKEGDGKFTTVEENK